MLKGPHPWTFYRSHHPLHTPLEWVGPNIFRFLFHKRCLICWLGLPERLIELAFQKKKKTHLRGVTFVKGPCHGSGG
jgi:hypothetical protein